MALLLVQPTVYATLSNINDINRLGDIGCPFHFQFAQATYQNFVRNGAHKLREKPPRPSSDEG
jgi:hypothetical protein